MKKLYFPGSLSGSQTGWSTGMQFCDNASGDGGGQARQRRLCVLMESWCQVSWPIGSKRIFGGQRRLSLSICLRRADKVRLTWHRHGVVGKAQVVLGYPGEAPVPSRNASSGPTSQWFTCRHRERKPLLKWEGVQLNNDCSSLCLFGLAGCRWFGIHL